MTLIGHFVYFRPLAILRNGHHRIHRSFLYDFRFFATGDSDNQNQEYLRNLSWDVQSDNYRSSLLAGLWYSDR